MVTRARHPRSLAMAWALGFGVAGWALLWLGRFPFLRVGWSDPWGWLATVDPEVGVAAIARLLGLALVGWVTASTVLYLGARLLGVQAPTIDWLSIAPLRKAVDAVLAGSLVVTTLGPVAAVAAEEPVTAVETTRPSSGDMVTPGYVPVPAGWPTPDQPTRTDPPSEAPPLLPDPAEATGSHAGSVIVVTGDNLWDLAESRMAAVLGRRPTEAETAPYWVRVIEANRERLRSADPDLIYAGEEILLPSISPES